MANSTTNLDTITTTQEGKEVVVNGLLDAASPSMLYARHDSACVGLTWAYYGGKFFLPDGSIADIANGTLTLTASATNYVEVDPATGTISFNTTGFTVGRTKIYSVATGVGTVTSYIDYRAFNILAPGTLAVIADKTILSNVSGAPTTPVANTLSALFDAILGTTVGSLLRRATTGWLADLLFDTDTSLTANSDTRIPSQKAIKAYVDSIVTGGASDVMLFKGVIDCSANPNYPAGDAGHLYKVSVSGKIGGASGADVRAGDTLYCITDGSASGDQAAVGANWNIAEENLTASSFGAFINALTGKTTPVDADYVGVMDSADSNKFKKLSWANLKATLKTYFDGLYRAFAPRVQSVAYAASVTLDCSAYDVFKITLTGNITIAFTGAADGQKVEVRLTQDGTGSRLVTWDAAVAFGSDLTSANTTASTGANKRDKYGFEYDSGVSKYDMVACSRGY